jgi:hypothetical protein
MELNFYKCSFFDDAGIELPTIDSEGQYDIILRTYSFITAPPPNYEFLCFKMKAFDVSLLKIMYYITACFHFF